MSNFILSYISYPLISDDLRKTLIAYRQRTTRVNARLQYSILKLDYCSINFVDSFKDKDLFSNKRN